MGDRDLHRKYYPDATQKIGVVDQYMWAEKDTNEYPANNGVSRPIYSCSGNISYSLPLSEWPKLGTVHPEIRMTRRQHLNLREPVRIERYEAPPGASYPGGASGGASDGRLEGFYHPASGSGESGFVGSDGDASNFQRSSYSTRYHGKIVSDPYGWERRAKGCM